MKEEGKGSTAPLTESFLHYPNNKYVLLALLGATAGQGVVWYTGQFYALFFLTITLKLDYVSAYSLIALSLLIGTPFFIFFGWLSDRIGRLKIILAGCLIAAVTFFPLFRGLTHFVNPDLEAFAEKNPITVSADQSTCNFHIFVGPWSNFTQCDRAQDFLTKSGLSFKIVSVPGSKSVDMTIGSTKVEGWDNAKWTAALKAAGYSSTADRAKVNWFMAELILVIMVLYVTMVYGPIAAFLCDSVRSRDRSRARRTRQLARIPARSTGSGTRPVAISRSTASETMGRRRSSRVDSGGSRRRGCGAPPPRTVGCR